MRRTCVCLIGLKLTRLLYLYQCMQFECAGLVGIVVLLGCIGILVSKLSAVSCKHQT